MFQDIHVQRVVLSLLLPPASLLLLVALGLLLIRTRLRRAGRGMIASGLLLLYLLSLFPVAALLLRPLESQHRPVAEASADAVVVLVAGILDRTRLDLQPEPDSTSMRRLIEGIRLHRVQPRQTPLVICGGKADPGHPDVSIGAVVARAAIDLGIPEEKVLLEDASTNTSEGAERVAALLKDRFGEPGRILLVTSAYHLGRAVDFFEAQGFEVVPAPCDYKGQMQVPGLHALIPHAGAMRLSAAAAYEYLVRLGYAVL